MADGLGDCMPFPWAWLPPASPPLQDGVWALAFNSAKGESLLGRLPM